MTKKFLGVLGAMVMFTACLSAPAAAQPASLTVISPSTVHRLEKQPPPTQAMIDESTYKLKHPSKSSSVARRGSNPCPLLPADVCYFYAGRGQTFAAGSEITAVNSNIRIANPTMDNTNEYHSLAELSLEQGTGSSRQIVEIGWQKSQYLYGDNDTHLFTYSWVNGVGMGYNASNPNWVDVAGNPINAGASLTALGVVGTSKFFTVQWDATTGGGVGAWWFYYDNTAIGYILGTQWTGASPSVTFNKSPRVQYFGEVPSNCTNPYSDMGQGTQGSTAALPAAYFGSINYSSGSSTVNPSFTTVTNSAYYTVGTTTSPRTFYFGGSGAGSGTGPC